MNITIGAGPQFRSVGSRLSAVALANLLHDALARQHTRKALARLDRHQLADVGISREQAIAEAAKPFWIR